MRIAAPGDLHGLMVVVRWSDFASWWAVAPARKNLKLRRFALICTVIFCGLLVLPWTVPLVRVSFRRKPSPPARQSSHPCLSDLCHGTRITQEHSHRACCCSSSRDTKNSSRLVADLVTVPREADIAAQYSSANVKAGGFWRPGDCEGNQTVALIIPFRRRESHLLIFLKHIHGYLRRQKLSYAVYVVDQVDDLEFNRAMLFNVGVLEALKDRNYSCFVFHDVDHIPVDPMLSYRCDSQPIHMAVRVDKWNWDLPYQTYCGGVTKQLTSQIFQMNGFSNLFWGWGGEDDDLMIRWSAARLKFERPPLGQGQYATVQVNHYRDRSKSRATRFNSNHLLKSSATRIGRDGINTTRYGVRDRKRTSLYTRLAVELTVDESFLYLYATPALRFW